MPGNRRSLDARGAQPAAEQSGEIVVLLGGDSLLALSQFPGWPFLRFANFDVRSGAGMPAAGKNARPTLTIEMLSASRTIFVHGLDRARINRALRPRSIYWRSTPFHPPLWHS